MMFTIENILGDKLRPPSSSSSVGEERRTLPQGNYCETDRETAKCVHPAAPFAGERRFTASPSTSPAAVIWTENSNTNTTTQLSRAPQPKALAVKVEEDEERGADRKRKSMSDGEDDISGKIRHLQILLYS